MKFTAFATFAGCSFFLSACATTGSSAIMTAEQWRAVQSAACPELIERRDNLRQYVDDPLASLAHDPDAQITKIAELLEMAPDKPYIRRNLLKRRYTAYLSTRDVAGAIDDLETIRNDDLAYPPEAVWIDQEIEQLKSGMLPSADGPEPLVRIPPRLPANANKSGHCYVELAVNPDGTTRNVKALYCTDDVFREASVQSVASWRYQPSENGATQIRTTVSFILMESNGCPVPA